MNEVELSMFRLNPLTLLNNLKMYCLVSELVHL